MEITRKCDVCKSFLVLGKDNVIFNKDKYMHFDCLVEKETNKKRGRLTKEEAIKKALELQAKNNYHIQIMILKEEFYRWIMYSYGIVSLPPYFCVKIDGITKGKHKGLAVPIPLEDLFDMWKRKKTELDKIAYRNELKGTAMSNEQRLYYDLAILVGKYDSYLKWKEKQRIAEQELMDQKLNQLSRINFGKINAKVNSSKNSINIADILNEI